MGRRLFRSILLVGVLAVSATGLWYLGQRWLLESSYTRDSEVANRLIEEGSYAEAIPILQRSLEVARQFDAKDPRLDQALQELAAAYDAQGDYVQSQHLYFTSFQNRVAKYGFAHPETAAVLFKLGRSYELQDLPDVAEGMYNQAISSWEQMKRADDPESTAAYLGLARVLLKLHRYGEAADTHAKAVAIQERVLGADSPELAPLIDAHGALLDAAGRAADAQQARDRARRLKPEPKAEEPQTAVTAAPTADVSPSAAPPATTAPEAPAEKN